MFKKLLKLKHKTLNQQELLRLRLPLKTSFYALQSHSQRKITHLLGITYN